MVNTQEKTTIDNNIEDQFASSAYKVFLHVCENSKYITISDIESYYKLVKDSFDRIQSRLSSNSHNESIKVQNLQSGLKVTLFGISAIMITDTRMQQTPTIGYKLIFTDGIDNKLRSGFVIPMFENDISWYFYEVEEAVKFPRFIKRYWYKFVTPKILYVSELPTLKLLAVKD